MTPRCIRIGLIVVLACCVGNGLAWFWMARKHQQGTLEWTRLVALNLTQHSRLEALRDERSVMPQRVSSDETVAPEEERRERVRRLVDDLEEARKSNPPRRVPPPPVGPKGDIFPELMDDPEYVRLSMIVRRYGEQIHFATVFGWAGVPPEKQARLHELMLDMQFAESDAALAAQKTGAAEIEVRQALQEARDGVYAEIRDLLGAETFARFRYAWESGGVNEPVELVKALETRLSYSDSPLTAEQTHRVFGAALEEKVGFMVTPEQIESLVQRARSFLPPAQLAAFREVATEFNCGKRVVVSESSAESGAR